MSLPRLSVQRPITTVMLLLSILVFGVIAANRLRLAFLPEVDAPFVGVVVPYPNSSPLTIEKEITKPIEEVLATLSGVKRMRSSSDADAAQVFLIFDWGQEIDVVRMQVAELVEQVKPELPAGIGQVQIFSFNTNDIPVVEARLSAEGVDLSASYELLESRILNRIRRVPGVARVDLDGVAPRQIYIDLVIDKIKAHGVDIGELLTTLQGASANLVLGEVHDGGLRYTARALGSFGNLQTLENLVINNQGLRLADVATVSYEEPPISYGRLLNGDEAIALNVFKESTANTVETVRAVMDVINNDINHDPLLKGVSVFQWQDQGKEIVNALNGLTSSGFQGGLLAVAVLYFFLRRWGTTLIVSLAIPFSVIATCGVLYFMGKTLNVLSMMGLMLGVGMLVDNAIVVLEAIDRRSRDITDRKLAAILGSDSVAMAVTASTLTSLIVFLPLVLGGKNELTTWLAEVGLAISLALAISLFASLTLIPLAASRFVGTGEAKPVRSIQWVEDRYVRLLAWTQRSPLKTLGLLSLGMVIGVVPMLTGWVNSSVFSGAVNDRLALEYEFADFAYKSRAREAVETVEAYLLPRRQELGIESVYSYFSSENTQTTLTLARKDLGDEEVKELRKTIREGLPELPGVRLVFDEDEEQSTGGTSFVVNLFGQDSAVLTRLAEEASRRIETVPGVADLRSTLGEGRQEFQVRIDRDKAARLNLTAQEVSNVFSFTLAGVRLPRFNAGDREVETELALRFEDRGNLADLKQLPIRSVEGLPVTLGDVASFEVIDRPTQIQRENRKVRVGVRANYEGEEWDQTKEQIETLMNSFALPPGYSWSWSQRMLDNEQQGAEMGQNFLLALALVYLVMAALFESLAQPFAILFSIPFALPGVFWMLAITNTPFNLMAQIGILILMGIVVNNGIVLLDHLNQLRKQGMEREAAVLQAGRDRMRAILMTAGTTVLGLVPLAFGGSRVGGLFYYPLALVVMGGLMSSVVLTLLVLPYVTFRVEAFAEWLSKLWRLSAPRPKASEVPAGAVEVA